jgi:hypothetical protein
MVSGISEHLTDDAGRLADLLVDDGGGHNLEEVRLQCGGDRTGEESLACSWGAVKQHTLWRLDSNPNEKFGVDER